MCIVYGPTAWDRPHASNVIQYATDIENTMFEAATSKEKYYQLVREKINQISKEPEESRKIEKEVEKRMRMEGG